MADDEAKYEDTPTIETSQSDFDDNNKNSRHPITTNNIKQHPSTETNDQTDDDNPSMQIVYSRPSQSQKKLISDTNGHDNNTLPTTDLLENNASTLSESGIVDVVNSNNKNQTLVQIELPIIHSNSKPTTVSLSPGKKTSIKSRISGDGFEIDVGSDTDTDDESLSDHHKNIEMKRIDTKYDDNEFKHLPYEEELIERLSIALTYLLHEKSPLWMNDDDDDEFDEDLLLVSPKTEKEKNKNPKFNYTASSEKISFQKKCMEYAQNASSMMGQLRTAEKKLNALYDNSYPARWKSLHYFWVDWKQNAEQLLREYELKKNGDLPNEDDDEEFEDLSLEEEEHLEVE